MDSVRNSAQAHTLLSQEFVRTAERIQGSTVHVRSGRMGGGSGVIWTSGGLVVTNAHVARSSRPTIELRDGRTLDAQIIDIDKHRDLAALKIDAVGLPAIDPGNSDALRVGQLVVAIGNPLGLTGALTVGIIHALAPPGTRDKQHWVQADIDLAPGNSGGPLVDVSGRVIGINSMVSGGLALSVPSNEVTAFLTRSAARPHLGVTTRPVVVDLDGQKRSGLLVLHAEAGSVAERCGIILGDVLIGIHGIPISGSGDLISALQKCAAGSTLHLDALRGGIYCVFEVVTGPHKRIGRGTFTEAA
ncbi:MAG: hypothetical protein NVSMB52_02690 [Chloroflexota bacterium]